MYKVNRSPSFYGSCDFIAILSLRYATFRDNREAENAVAALEDAPFLGPNCLCLAKGHLRFEW